MQSLTYPLHRHPRAPRHLQLLIAGFSRIAKLFMNHPPRYDRLIIALNDDELEGFVREWALRKTEYLEVQRFTGPGDMGRDVVGYRDIYWRPNEWSDWFIFVAGEVDRPMLRPPFIATVRAVITMHRRAKQPASTRTR